MIPSPFYRASELRDHYNELTLRFKKDWNVEFRAYNDGIAYRFVSRAKKPFNVVDETVDYHFPSDMVASVPYVKQERMVIMTLNISIHSKILILPIHYRS